MIFFNIFSVLAERPAADDLEATYLNALRNQQQMRESGKDTTSIDVMVQKLEALIEGKAKAAAAAEREAERASVKEQADRDAAMLQSISDDITKCSAEIAACTDPTEIQNLQSILDAEKIVEAGKAER
jgi:hypothetical protein